jgi:hypothetical protein
VNSKKQTKKQKEQYMYRLNKVRSVYSFSYASHLTCHRMFHTKKACGTITHRKM